MKELFKKIKMSFCGSPAKSEQSESTILERVLIAKNKTQSKSDLSDLKMMPTDPVGKNKDALDLVKEVDKPAEVRMDLFGDGEIEAELPDTDGVESELLNHEDIEEDLVEKDGVVKNFKEDDQIADIEKEV